MQDTITDSRRVYSLSDFLQNHEAHLAHLKETKTPEVLTIDGRAEVVLLAPESYEALLAQVNHTEAVAAVRAIIRQAKSAGPEPEITEAEVERRQAVVREIMAETERLGPYQ